MSHRIKGWCPGALRPMESGDGLIVRVRITGGILSTDRALAIARAAREHGNGLIDLSNRANLQLRGVSEASLPRMQAVLAGLGLLDPDAETEAVRNIIASPLAGVDPTLLIDVVAATTSLESALRAAGDLTALPAKFGFLIDGGGVLPLTGVSPDLRFVAVARGRVRVEAGEEILGDIDESAIADEAVRLARLFLAGRLPNERRMAPFATRLGAAGLVAHRPASTTPVAVAAREDSTGPQSRFALAAAPFGRLRADQLEGLARIAAGAGADLRLTPWRAIVVTAATPDATIAALGLIPGLDDPRLRVEACPGAPACRSGEAATQADGLMLAVWLADLLAPGVRLHVSGCPKGCARAAKATVSLTAREGLYALAFDAMADDPRQTEPLSLKDAAEAIRYRLSRPSPAAEPVHA